MVVYGSELNFPLSHGLPFYLMKHPFYDSLPGRISSFLRHSQDTISLIDIGANVGDTLAAFHLNARDQAIAVEPNGHFHSYLRRNWSHHPGVTFINALCGANNTEGRYAINENSGTAQFQATTTGSAMQQSSLDRICESSPNLGRIDIIKTDTDGYDFEVIKGAMETISQYTPFILMECDSFGNESYIKDCITTVEKLNQIHYQTVLAYDNLGHLIGAFHTNDTDKIRDLIVYQLSSGHMYLDLLFMPNNHSKTFLEQEREFFQSRLTQTVINVRQ
jgi:FkbM family methyltransferase